MPLLSPRNAGVDRPSQHGFLLMVALVALFAGAKPVLYDTLDPDCFWHLRVGEQLIREGVRPLRDSLSFASTREPWTPYSWLAEIGMAKLWAFGGFRAAIPPTPRLVTGMVLTIAAACREAVRGSFDEGRLQDVNHRRLATVVAVAFA